MTNRIFYVNGTFVPEDEARISVLDRGFIFGDGVYEVCAVLSSKLIANDAHLARLERSLGELKLEAPIALSAIPALQKELVQKNDLVEGLIYLQVTRGPADRDFAFPKVASPTLIMFTQPLTMIDDPAAQRGLRVISLPDIRWKRRDIKTVNLLGPVLAKQEAKARGVDDAWMVEDDFVTEGTSNNAFIVTQDGTIITRHLSHNILHGITRADVLKEAGANSLNFEERPFTIDEVLGAKEAFITSASAFVMPVVEMDGNPIGDGKPGPITKQLRAAYIEHARKTAD